MDNEVVQLDANAVIETLLDQIKVLSLDNAKLKTQIGQMSAAMRASAESSKASKAIDKEAK